MKKMKIIKFLVVLALLLGSFMMLNVASGVDSVNAALSQDEFYDFRFEVSPKIKNSEIIWSVDLNWTTEKEIKYLKVIISLENGLEEPTYESGRHNISKYIISEKYVDEETINYQNNLHFDVNSKELQLIKVTLYYSYEDSIDPINIENKVLFLSTGETIINEDINLGFAVLAGIFISICASFATYIIIQNTKNNLIKTKIIKEEDDDE